MRAQLQGWFQSSGDYATTLIANERRKSQRHITVLQVAKLVTETCEELCIVRDISSGGLKAEIYCPLQLDDKVQIQFKSGQQVDGHVVWLEDRQAGIEFDQTIETERLLVRRERDPEGNPVRAPRLKVDMPGMLRVNGEQACVHVGDISQDGCKVHSDLLLKPGIGCEISLPGLGFRMAAVRWFRDNEAGVRFHERLSYQEFAQWRHRLVSGGI
ncbi:PilZ domain-containing protein [Sphingomonas sp. JC676]|uniref:PilZ domain-containing protein n=1 Tax=Sphingomonas sp. JC676 TaxID=2768065 RepID=UPI001657C14A|nr:PilZ domain-containing protein [Sphingomonas sp. JC676]MBC9032974.1 PilZ domain-containing protein [Sphingomonas sp. JC676]